MKETDALVDKLQSFTLKDDEIGKEFLNDFGHRLLCVREALLIEEIGSQLHCSIIIIARAQVLFHRYKQLQKEPFNPIIVAASCLYLSSTSFKQDIEVDELIKKFYRVNLKKPPNPPRPDPSSEELIGLKRKFHLALFAVCKKLSCELGSKIAHTYVYKFLAQLNSLCNVTEGIMVLMSSTATKLLSTYYLCEGCLKYEAEEIAIACLVFLYLIYGTHTPSIKYLMKKELSSIESKVKIMEILDELCVVSNISTSFG